MLSCLPWPGPGGGAGSTPFTPITLLSHAQAIANATSVTTGAISTTGASLIVVAVQFYSASSTPSLTDSAGNTWTLINVGSGGFAVQYNALFYCASPATSGSHTFTATASIGFAQPGICVTAWNNTAASPLVGASSDSTASFSTTQPGSITPPSGRCLFVTGAAQGAGTLNTPTGFTQSDQGTTVSGWSYQTCYLVEGGSAIAQNPTFTNSFNWISIGMACFTHI
jgi:hypothetical protein